MDALLFCISRAVLKWWIPCIFFFARWVMTVRDSDGLLLGKLFFFFLHDIRLSSSLGEPEQEKCPDGFEQLFRDSDEEM